jgi:peptide/nickel transport system substrate-binding protein
MSSKRSWGRAAALLLAVGLVAAACGDDGGGSKNASGASTGTGSGSAATATTTTLAPQKGGTLTVGMFSYPASLDPAKSSGSGTAGGTELISIYDTITRWNPDTRKYEMRTADSVTSNTDASEWTLKLKSGIKFRDGTAYDADAVKYNWDRYMSTVNISTSRSWLSYVVGDPKNVTVVDPLTVKFVLKVPYAGFPALLAHTPGMIVSPTILKPTGAGAGPFEISEFSPNDNITVKADPNYYGGAPYVDAVKFVNLNDSSKTVDALKTGTLNVGFLRTPVSTSDARADKTLGGYDNYIQAGDMLLTNQGVKVTCTAGKPEPLCVGQPDGALSTKPNTADALIRKAAVEAIDPATINDRVNSGKGTPNTALFDKNFTLSPGVEGNKPDAAQAKKDLDAAKAAGASGKIRLACTNQADRVALAQTIDTQLKAVGFITDVHADIDTKTQIAQITTQKDFDLGCWGLSMPNDDTAILALVQNFWSASPTNRVGYSNPAWDAALNVALGAKDDAAKKAANKTLADLWNKDTPSIIYNTTVERIAWQNKVHGVYLDESSMFYLDKAWIEK